MTEAILSRANEQQQHNHKQYNRRVGFAELIECHFDVALMADDCWGSP